MTWRATVLTIFPEMLPGNVAGEVTALVNSMGALGSFVGSWVVGFLQGYTGNSKAGYLFMSASLLLAGGSMLLLRPVAPMAGRGTAAVRAGRRLSGHVATSGSSTPGCSRNTCTSSQRMWYMVT